MQALFATGPDKVETASVRTTQELAAVKSCQPGIST